MQASENTPQDQLTPMASQSLPELVFGDTGNAVRLLQKVLIHLGPQYLTDGQWNGRFDSPTADAVSKFQQDNGLVADGIVGDNTWRVLTNQIKFEVDQS
jgi:peptidoglycan hydrolase-like protein with peptidoglycan-binding domain